MRVTNWTEQQLTKTENSFNFAKRYEVIKNISVQAIDDGSMNIDAHIIGYIKFRQPAINHYCCTIEFVKPMKAMRAGGSGSTMVEALVDALEIIGFKFNSPAKDIKELIEAVLYDKDFSLVSLQDI